MTKKTFIPALSLTVFIACATVVAVLFSTAKRERNGQLALTVQATPGDVSRLSLLLKNGSQRPITIYQESLPWDSPYAILLVGIVSHVEEQPLHILPGPD